MLTKRQNLLETIRGGNPDRFVNQYEYLICQPEGYGMIMANPVTAASPRPVPGGPPDCQRLGRNHPVPRRRAGCFPGA